MEPISKLPVSTSPLTPLKAKSEALTEPAKAPPVDHKLGVLGVDTSLRPTSYPSAMELSAVADSILASTADYPGDPGSITSEEQKAPQAPGSAGGSPSNFPDQSNQPAQPGGNDKLS